MAKPTTLPRPWATNAVYLTGPFAGLAGKADPGIGVAAEGHRPGAADPTAAEHENYQQNLITADWIPWVNAGSAVGTATAHIVETTSLGRAGLYALDVADGADETAVNITGTSSVAPAMFVRNNAAGPVITVLANAAATSDALRVNMTGAMAGAGISVNATATSSGHAIVVTVPASSSSQGLNVYSESSTSTAFLKNQSNGKALELQASSGTGIDVVVGGAYGEIINGGTVASLFAQATAGGTGVSSSSGTTAGANAILGLLRNNTGFAVYGQTAAAATSVSRAGYFSANGNGVGLECIAALNHPLVLSPKVSAPTNGALLQNGTLNAVPTNVASGQLAHVGSTFNTWMHSSFVESAWRAFWSSLGGFCFGESSNQFVTNNDAAVYTTLCTVTLTAPNEPKLAGQRVRITLTARGGALTTGTPGYIDVRIRDTTAGVNILTRAGTGITAASGYYFPNAAGAMEREIAIDTMYIIPTAGSRTFVAEVKKNTAGTNQITVQGSMVITGSYT